MDRTLLRQLRAGGKVPLPLQGGAPGGLAGAHRRCPSDGSSARQPGRANFNAAASWRRRRRWIRWQETTGALRPGTRVTYNYLLRRFLLPAFESTPLNTLDPVTVRAWLAGLHRAGDVTPTTIAKAYRLLRRILNVAVEAGYLARNPCVIKGAGVERATEMRHVTIPQLHQLADAVPACCKALILVAGYGGLRWAELVGLRRHHIDVANARVRVIERTAEVAGKCIVSPPKTNAGQRVVTLPAAAMTALAEHLDCYTNPDPNALVFPSARGKYLARSSFRRLVWRPAIVAVGLDGVRFHDLRHTAATLAAATGATTKELMARMGHTSPAVAFRYQHVMADRDAQIAAWLDRLAKQVMRRKGTGRARRTRSSKPRKSG